MINAGTVAAFLTLDTEKFDKGIKGANAQLLALGDDNMKMRDKLKGVGSALTDIGRTMTTHVTLPLAGAGLAALNVAANFDEGMSKVAAISGATGSELDALRDKAREMGAKTKFSATEAADAMSYMAMAGWKTEEMLGGIEGIMSLAAASG
ncbi:MAG: phage tail tape measure protein, partial [Clostridia bacterium]|nr:phage tail tape measure protein [Clostridia bacterium]